MKRGRSRENLYGCERGAHPTVSYNSGKGYGGEYGGDKVETASKPSPPQAEHEPLDKPLANAVAQRLEPTVHGIALLIVIKPPRARHSRPHRTGNGRPGRRICLLRLRR